MSDAIRNLYWNIRHGVRNVWRYGPLIWRDRDWDWDYLAAILELKLSSMAERFERHNLHVGADRDARRMRVCVALIRRLRADNHMSLAGCHGPDWHSLPEWWQSELLKRGARNEANDCRYLGFLIGKWMLRWWD